MLLEIILTYKKIYMMPWADTYTNSNITSIKLRYMYMCIMLYMYLLLLSHIEIMRACIDSKISSLCKYGSYENNT